MKNQVTITDKMLMVNVQFPIEVGQLKLTAVAQLHIEREDDGSSSADCDFVDVINITYMEMPINGYKDFQKFKQFHKEMGIDFDKLIDDKFEKVMTDEFVKELVKDIVF